MLVFRGVLVRVYHHPKGSVAPFFALKRDVICQVVGRISHGLDRSLGFSRKAILHLDVPDRNLGSMVIGSTGCFTYL